VFDIQRELQAVFEDIRENEFHGAFEVWVALYLPKEDISKEMAARIQ
jgi:hypothetical protein